MLTATAFLAPAAVVGLALAADGMGPRVALAYAIVILGGWVSLTIVGMMLKIVPFLVWYHAYGSRAGREPVPTMAELSWPRAEGFAYAFLTGGVVLLVASVYAGDPAWIRSAGLVLAIGALAFAGALARILGHLVRARGRRSPLGSASPSALADAEARKT
ncbi:MAG TPA: hypothetical protein VML54_07050 [Candidatus Limnocylindrales bacterium]|nr:hypothetical protein [Candidatus Limnocylindrales bacterium]